MQQNEVTALDLFYSESRVRSFKNILDSVFLRVSQMEGKGTHETQL